MVRRRDLITPNPKLKPLDQVREVLRLLLPAMPASHNPLFHPPCLPPMCQLPALYLLSLVPQGATRPSSPKLSQNGTPGSWRKSSPVNDRRGWGRPEMPGNGPDQPRRSPLLAKPGQARRPPPPPALPRLTSPLPHRYLTVEPLQGLQRFNGEVTVRRRWGEGWGRWGASAIGRRPAPRQVPARSISKANELGSCARKSGELMSAEWMSSAYELMGCVRESKAKPQSCSSFRRARAPWFVAASWPPVAEWCVCDKLSRVPWERGRRMG